MTRFLTLLAAALCFTCAAAHAATCSLSQSAIAISGYDVFPATDKIVPVASGTLVLHCSNLNAGTTTVKVGVSGANSSTAYQNPAITLGSSNLTYSLTLPGNSSLQWNLTNVFQQNISPNGGGNANVNIPAFNLDVIAQQDVTVGTTYAGNLYFTVTCSGASAC